MKRPRRIPFDRLTGAQKESIYRECEQLRPEHGAPLNARDRQRHRRAGVPVGRPRIGKGVKRINLSVEMDLLRTADAFARRNGLTRARLIAESIRAYLKGAA